MNLKQLLGKLDFFQGLDEKIVSRVADAAIVRQYAKDEAIVRQGEMGLGLYVIMRGRVQVEREQGDKRVPIAELQAEQSFAEMAIIDNQPRSATVRAIEETETILLTRDSFVKLMQKYPEIAVRIAKLLAERLRTANDKLAAMQSAPAQAAAPGPGPNAPATPAPSASGSSNATASNGSAPVPAGPGMKQDIQGKMLGWFENLYTIKAMTRFSVAVLGCPVEGVSADAVETIRVGDVKAVVLRAGSAMRIEASEPGPFTLHVFEPGAPRPTRFGPVDLEPGEDCLLALGKGAPRLTRSGLGIDPLAN